MGESSNPMATSSSSPSSSIPPSPTTTTTPPRQHLLLQPPSSKKKKNRTNVFRVLRTVFRSFPIFTAPSVACKIPVIHPGLGLPDPHHNTSRITGTLFGYRKGRVSLSIQENPKCLPSLVVELAMQTTTLQKELSTGMVRIALETEKQPRADNNNSKTEKKTDILEEPLWTMYCKGEKTGYGVKREATEEDLNVMELLRPVSMGAGVLPGNSESEGPDGEMAYMRAYFERVIGSKDSETFYMLSPEGNNGPELSFFFVRV
ncbi:Protein MIZU-KUSSEI 1-like plant [Arabidopsis thaliana x Arabidopsis arenosa]|uniref:Protein MIZU-KUSSEI 1-like plant n=2 Tax=Arabidopsis TaxID=3701 RepID=A0A8T1YEK2_ARASU|nr:Protein MIZU-KUSSEI 1-like plant [Arabidopsis thaliana x Arabidopsis arenosa]KAG7544583.1 Protein MIZU-KUSSEI 1-like plant [Arabidopsis suecica]